MGMRGVRRRLQGFRVDGLGVCGLGFRVEGLGFGVCRFRVSLKFQEFEVSSFRFGVQSLGFRISGAWCTIPSHPLPASPPSNDIFVDCILPPSSPECSNTLPPRVEKETEGDCTADGSAASRLERDGDPAPRALPRVERDGDAPPRWVPEVKEDEGRRGTPAAERGEVEGIARVGPNMLLSASSASHLRFGF